ncbi:MAG: hypothetical protein HZA54_06805 [Planctomycetes bacterium]|nr:hypothetical protein [Planctomycetota bacterium]
MSLRFAGTAGLRSLALLGLCALVLAGAPGCKRRGGGSAPPPPELAPLLEFKFEADASVYANPEECQFPSKAPLGYRWYTHGPGSEQGQGTPVLLPDASFLGPEDIWYATLGSDRQTGDEVLLVLTPGAADRLDDVLAANEGKHFFVLMHGSILYIDLLKSRTPRDFARIHGPLAETTALSLVSGLDHRGAEMTWSATAPATHASAAPMSTAEAAPAAAAPKPHRAAMSGAAPARDRSR